MLSGDELGKALTAAMQRKKVGPTAVAEAFDVKPPSVKDWQKFGRIHKKHIPRLVEYFRDVVGPEHWGLPATWDAVAAPIPDRALSDDEAELLAAYRLISESDKADVRAKAIQLALERNHEIARLLEVMGIATRADDATVLDWWHHIQAKHPRGTTLIPDTPATTASADQLSTRVRRGDS